MGRAVNTITTKEVCFFFLSYRLHQNKHTRIEFFFLLVTGISRRAPHSKDGASLSLRVRLNRSPKPQSISYVGSSSGSVCVWPWNCSLRIRTVSETSRRASAVSGGVLAVSSSATCTALPRCARGSICHVGKTYITTNLSFIANVVAVTRNSYWNK